MIAIVTLILVVGLSMLVTKIATIALIHTGLTREQARFQARSAFTGSGFTTSESELVLKHPLRRQIITILMVTGNAGFVTVISTLILGFLQKDGHAAPWQLFLLLSGGLGFLYLTTRSSRIDLVLTRVINWWLKNYTDIKVSDFSRLLTVMEDYEVTELPVENSGFFTDKRLSELRLTDQGLLVLGIVRKGETYLGIPQGSDLIDGEDKLIVYGKSNRIAALAERKAE